MSDDCFSLFAFFITGSSQMRGSHLVSSSCWRQQLSGSTERGWPLLEESPLAESCCSAPEHSQIVCLARKEFKTWGRKWAAVMWGSDEQGQQANVLGLYEKRYSLFYIVNKVGLKQSHLKHLHVSNDSWHHHQENPWSLSINLRFTWDLHAEMPFWSGVAGL